MEIKIYKLKKYNYGNSAYVPCSYVNFAPRLRKSWTSNKLALKHANKSFSNRLSRWFLGLLWSSSLPHTSRRAAQGGRRFRLETMLSVNFIQHLFSLSEPAIEEPFLERPMYKDFAQLWEFRSMPGESTISLSRNRMKKDKLAMKIGRG